MLATVHVGRDLGSQSRWFSNGPLFFRVIVGLMIMESVVSYAL